MITACSLLLSESPGACERSFKRLRQEMSAQPLELVDVPQQTQLPVSPQGQLTVTKLDVLVQPRYDQVLSLENECFPACERLGGPLMQQQTALRTSGLLIAELGATFAGYLLFSRSAAVG